MVRDEADRGAERSVMKEASVTIEEIAKDILKKEDNELARAFTMLIGSLLLSKGIKPIINKSIEEWNANDDLNKYIIRKEYNVTFDIDTTEHDAKVRADAIDEFAHELKKTFNNEFPLGYYCTKPFFSLDYVRGLVDRVYRHMKEQKNE